MFLYEIARAVAICVIRARDTPSPSRRFRVTATSVARVRARTPSNPSGRNCLRSSTRRVGLERARVRSTSSQLPSLACHVDTKRALDASTSRHSTARRNHSVQTTFSRVFSVAGTRWGVHRARRGLRASTPLPKPFFEHHHSVKNRRDMYAAAHHTRVHVLCRVVK